MKKLMIGLTTILSALPVVLADVEPPVETGVPEFTIIAVVIVAIVVVGYILAKKGKK